MKVVLSFDIEEFDAPLEYGGSISTEHQIAYSVEGTKRILDLLEKYNIKATFYCTAKFAQYSPQLVKQIILKGHELASHGYNHSSFELADLKRSKDFLEEKFTAKIYGYRMARMMELNLEEVEKAGYIYDSSLNPTYIPGRYNKRNMPRTIYKENNLWIVPASVSPIFRIPLFWLALHNFPLRFYTFLAKRTLKKDGYINIYFHPWEFIDHLKNEELKLPAMIKRNSGIKMISRLEHVIKQFVIMGASFSTTYDLVKNINERR